MKLSDYSYNNLFDNPFKIHVQTMEIKYFIIKDKNKPEIIEDKQDLKQTVTSASETILPVESVSYELKDITPKKRLWRK